MEKLISVIIPVYNVEQYLRKCLDSVIGQTYNNLDIILVDDGSSDGSAVICDEYAQKDDRITVIHKQNGGVSSARNAALNIIKGDYVCFVDADDYILPEMFERLLNEIQKGYDIAQCSYVFLYDDRTVSAATSVESREYFGKTEIINAFFTEKIQNQLWSKIFDRNVIQGNKFDESLKIAEDKLFVHECLVAAKSVKCIPDELYVYIQRGDSATKGKISEKHFDDIKVLDYLLPKYSLSEDIKESMLVNAAKIYLSLLFRIVGADDIFEREEECKNKILELRQVIFASKLFSKKEKIITHLLSFSPKLAYKIIRLYLKR